MHAILLGTFKCNTRTVHLSHAKAIVCFHAKHAFDLFPLFVCMRFSTDYERFKGGTARIDTFLLKNFGQANGVAGDRMQSCCLKVGDKLDLTLTVAGSSGYGQCSQSFGSVLESQSAGKHTIT